MPDVAQMNASAGPSHSERLIVRNFLVLREADIDIGRFTVLIGPQASGKSIVAKLAYYFRDFLGRHLFQAIEQKVDKRQMTREAVSRFERIFPNYAWGDAAFEIEYSYGDLRLTVARAKQKSKATSVVFTFSEAVTDIYLRLRAEYKERVRLDPGALFLVEEIATEILPGYARETAFQQPTFIPASRSFFATLQRHVFSFVARSLPIDPLIAQFGSVYASARVQYRSLWESDDYAGSAPLLGLLRRQIDSILIGDYQHIKGEDWIVTKEGRVNVTNASSGQQEALPMLVVLAASLAGEQGVSPLYVVEEPEAHLFPVSQRRLVNVFSLLYANSSCQFFLTTHSPYVLTAINNLVFAAGLVDRGDPATTHKVTRTITGAAPIRFADLRAYTIEGGKARSILDRKNRIIGSSVIDSVSDEFERVFDRLMSLQLDATA
jgi:hypothetical protein